jgi:replication factor C large subunit
MWSEKYRPESLEEMVGNEEGRTKLLGWLRKWKPGGKAALLVGPPGTGKTTTVHLVAAKLGLQLIELNASDSRTKDKLSKRIGEALSSASLFGGTTLVFLDEVDGLAGRADYGALDFIREAVRRSSSPVVMAANDAESEQVRKLGSVSTKIEFRRPPPEEVEVRVRKIADEESVSLSKDDLSRIVTSANGDLRAAVNSLQSGVPAQKDEELTASQSVNAFFEAADEKEALKALRSYPGQPRELLRDLLAAVVRSRVHEERKAAALDVLSRADVIIGRIVRGKDWRLRRYLDPLLAYELWRALGDGGPKYTLDAVPWVLQLRIWNDSRKLRDIAALSGRRLGISARGALVEDVPYMVVLCEDQGFRYGLAKSLGLEKNYADFLAKEAGRAARRQL